MVCYTPNIAYRSREFTVKGKRGITFDRNLAVSLEPVPLGCGQCIGCRLERVCDWAVRCMHEKKMHSHTEFVTLTYNDDCVPSGGTLRYSDVQKFWKRLRKKVGKFQFFVAGEYGGRTNRPHYHALLFGVFLEDRKFFKRNEYGDVIYTSELLNSVWQNGHCTTGEATFESAAYCASYTIDKVTGEQADRRYLSVDDDGCILELKPEFGQPSLKPAIGKTFFEKYWREIYETDSCVVNGREYPVPRYYDKLLEAIDPVLLDKVKKKRSDAAKRLIAVDNSYQTKHGLPRKLVKHIVAMEKRRVKKEV